MSSLPIIVSGPYGRMGQALCRLTQESQTLDLWAGLVSGETRVPDAAAIKPPNTVPELAAIPSPPAGQMVLIDFTAPAATLARLHEAAQLKIPVVVGTTGFSPDQHSEISKLSSAIPIVLAANMSVGVNLLLGVVEDLAARLQGYDIEVVETHHRLKKDAPSGTALALAKAAAAGRQLALENAARHGRKGLVGGRTSDEIGIHAVRGGDVVGDHTVLFAGIGERIEITHKASSRDAFASGALVAAKWLCQRAPGLYSMRDVLGLG